MSQLNPRCALKRKWIAFAFFLAAVPCLLLISRARQQKPIVGGPLPKFSLEDTDGQFISNDTLRTVPHDLIVFRTDCPACKRELLALASRHSLSSDNSSIILIAVDSLQNARSVQRSWRLPFRTCGRGLRFAQNDLHLQIVPALIRVSATGMIISIHEGSLDGNL